MKSQKTILSGIIIAAIALLALGLVVNRGNSGVEDSGQHLEGSWFVTAVANLAGEPPLHLTALLTCTADGGVVETPGTAFAVSTAHGAWRRLGNRTFAVTVVYLRRGDDGELSGTSKVRSTLTLDKTSARVQGRFETTVFDLAGNEINRFGGTAEATRIEVEPLN